MTRRSVFVVAIAAILIVCAGVAVTAVQIHRVQPHATLVPGPGR